MSFELPALPYEMDALEPNISKETLEYHYGKHHKAYVDNLNKLTEGKPEAEQSLEALIMSAGGPVFNNAAQSWNHTFYWHCMSPHGGDEPKDNALLTAINATFGSFADFKEQFSSAAATNFGSGWTWLIKDADGNLAIVNTGNAGNPMKDGHQPLLVIDIWEHAYYIDYRNLRPKYIENFWNLVNWEFVAKNFAN